VTDAWRSGAAIERRGAQSREGYSLAAQQRHSREHARRVEQHRPRQCKLSEQARCVVAAGIVAQHGCEPERQSGGEYGHVGLEWMGPGARGGSSTPCSCSTARER